MPSRNIEPSLTAKKYRDKYGMEMPTLKLARIMYDENRLLFKDVETARRVLRYIEGKGGKVDRDRAMNSKYFMAEERSRNPYELPESDEESYDPYVITGHKRIGIINDIHVPYHSIEAVTAAFDLLKKEKPDGIFINGDVLDCHQLSYFEKDPKKKQFSQELDVFKQFFDILKKTFNCKIYFKFGNHEERYERFLFQKAKELAGVEEFELANIIKARAEGIEIIEDRRIVLMNGLPFVHGHEFGRGFFSPVNAARGLFLRSKHTAVQGDCHSTSEHVEKDILGKIMTTWSVGCLCGLTPQWLPINKWNHGAATVDLDTNGYEFEFRNYRIYNGKVL
jgi:predicted phosphodiesterase